MIEIKVFVNYINPFLVLGWRMSSVPSYESFESNNTQYNKKQMKTATREKLLICCQVWYIYICTLLLM